MTLIGFAFPKWRSQQRWLDKCLKRPVPEGLSRRNMVNGPKHLKSATENLYHIHSSLTKQLSWKKSLELTCQLLGLFANLLDANDKYPVLNSYKLLIPMQMHLYQKRETFSHIFAEFLKSRWTFEDFEKKTWSS